ncbi:hypothetical protein SeMB42_g00662 [Synchytrium endobioticum]|uniref:Uncharacterized protein n=1 Tax=Synchytrium endobioticum TaxID=286115 RepID=A0A507DQW3_9FUNG|nr:hypothetical protein SeMB42_g00662 [Synchytrium endobioticum]
MNVEFTRDVRGIEAQFATNYLGPFYLTNLLLHNLRVSAPARVVNVLSSVHYAAHTVTFDSITSKSVYTGLGNYALSKFALMLFTRDLADRLKTTGVVVNACHPGVIATPLYRQTKWAAVLLATPLSWVMPQPIDGASRIIEAAIDSRYTDITGKYIAERRIWSMNPHVKHDAAARLWNISVDICGMKI